MDLLARKLGQDGGRPIQNLFERMRGCVQAAQKTEATAALAARLEPAVKRLEEVARHMGASAQADLMTASAHAHPFMEVVGDMVVGWMLLWRAQVAAAALAAGAKSKDVAFYEGQIKSAEFFVLNLLPVTLGRMASILGGSRVAVEIAEDSFGGK
jgi:hypothetical protein